MRLPLAAGKGVLCNYNVAVEFRVREYRQEDFERLWGIDQQCFPRGISYSRLELAHYIRRRGAFTLLAESDAAEAGEASPPPFTKRHTLLARPSARPAQAEILGFIVAQEEGHNTGHIVTLDVRPQARRWGVGSRLMSEAEQRLRARGARIIYLETAVDNLPALAFYKRHQYHLLNTIPRYYQNSVDAFVLGKRF